MNKLKKAKDNSDGKIKSENAVPSTSDFGQSAIPVRKTSRLNAGSNLYTRKIKLEPEDPDEVRKPGKSNENSKNLDTKKRGRSKKVDLTESTDSSKETEFVIISTPNKRGNNVTFTGIDESLEFEDSIVQSAYSAAAKRRKTANLSTSKNSANDASTRLKTNISKNPKKRKKREVRDDVVSKTCTSQVPRNRVNVASTRLKTNISKIPKKRNERELKVDVLPKTCTDQVIINDLLEIQDDSAKNKSGRPKKAKTEEVLCKFENEGKGESDISFDINFEFDVTEKGSRGRPKVTKEEIIPPKYYKMKDKPGRGVCCIKCNVLIPEHNWLKHNCLLHNNMAWRDGEKPVDFSNKEQVFRLWKQVVNQKLPLKCGKCNEKKLSVLGFYSHVRVCGKDLQEIEQQKVECNICGARIMPISLKMHIATIHGYSKEKGKSVTSDSVIQNIEKRKAASKALAKFKDLDTDTVQITDMYNQQPRSLKAPAYYITVWKTQLESGGARCLWPGCIFESKVLDSLIDHYSTCEKAPEKVYACKQCNFECVKQIEILRHVENAHMVAVAPTAKIKEELDENYKVDEELNLALVDKNVTAAGNNCSVSKRSSVISFSKKYCYKFSFLFREKEADITDHSYTPVILWTQQFRRLQYLDSLFLNYLPSIEKWTPLLRDYEKYLPKTKKSIHTSRIPVGQTMCDVRTYDHDWKQYNLFNVEMNSDVVTIFCGGPVRAMAWVPMPTSEVWDQYLAVVCKLDMDTFHKLGASYSKPGLIQMWNCGVLNDSLGFVSEPKLSFCIAHNYGIVWDMQWCPSGCYQENERLGMLALACSDSDVYIISVPFPDQLRKIDGRLPIFKTKPIFQLKLQDEDSKLLGDVEFQATKIAWNKIANHNIIAGGFTNGMVALWNLQSDSPLLKEVVDDTIILYPYLCFQAHYAPVTVIDFPSFDEVRWLFTASYDQQTKFWDLHDVKYPITEHKRSVATDGFWFPHWNCALVCYDDVLMQTATVTSLLSSRDFGYKPVPIFRTNSCCNCIAANEWLNGVAQGSVAGEWQMTFLTQIFFGLEYEKSLRSKRVLGGFTEWIDRTKSPEELIELDKRREQLSKKDLQEYTKLAENDVEILPNSYDEVAEKYGVIFCDFNLSDRSTMPNIAYEKIHNAESLKEFPNDMYPIASMNKMCWNPNDHSYRYIAIGYQVGFVRLHCVKFIKVRR